LQSGTTLTYRLNRGDIQGIREVWLDDVYRLPFDVTVDRVVDLGANIGLTSVYFAKKYGTKTIVAVEPNPANAELARRNFEQNGISARVIEAAIGPVDGFAHFSDALDSNLGAVSAAGREVRMISMSTLCAETPRLGSIDLLKMDIEGGEQALLSGSIEWLDGVRAIIAEFHPDIVDYPGLAERISGAGFRWYKAGAVYEHTTDAFIRVAESRGAHAVSASP
jgi:FkbM family methyltransferase